MCKKGGIRFSPRLFTRMLLVKISFCFVLSSLGNSLIQKNMPTTPSFHSILQHIFYVRKFPRYHSTKQKEILTINTLVNSWETRGYHLFVHQSVFSLTITSILNKLFFKILEIQRPAEVPQDGILCDILWSDPGKNVNGWEPSDRGVSYKFGPDIVDSFLNRNNLSLIVRAHQVVEDGYEFFNRRSLVTLFSAPNYCGQFDNAGAVMMVKEDLTCSFSILPVRIDACPNVK